MEPLAEPLAEPPKKINLDSPICILYTNSVISQKKSKDKDRAKDKAKTSVISTRVDDRTRHSLVKFGRSLKLRKMSAILDYIIIHREREGEQS